MNRRPGFSLIELLIVVMLISAGILPIYSLIKSGQKRISRADTRTLATLFGASAVEMIRTIGFDKVATKNINEDPDFKELAANARKNGFEIQTTILKIPIALPGRFRGSRPPELLRVDIEVIAVNRTAIVDVPKLKFVTVLSDPRYNFY